jgi:hypothetical protein
LIFYPSRILDPGVNGTGSSIRDTAWKYDQSRKYDPRCLSRILIFFSIPDPEVNKALDPDPQHCLQQTKAHLGLMPLWKLLRGLVTLLLPPLVCFTVLDVVGVVGVDAGGGGWAAAAAAVVADSK